MSSITHRVLCVCDRVEMYFPYSLCIIPTPITGSMMFSHKPLRCEYQCIINVLMCVSIVFHFFDSSSPPLLPPPPLFVSPLHSLSFPTMLSEHHHQDGWRYGGIWERSWLRPYSPSWGMVPGLHAFVHTHDHPLNIILQIAFGWLCDIAVLYRKLRCPLQNHRWGVAGS